MKLKFTLSLNKKFKKFLSWKTLYYATFGLCLLIIGFFTVFSYQFITNTITFTGEALRLKKIVSAESFQREDFEVIISNIEKKVSASKKFMETEIVNIFSFARGTTTIQTVPKPDAPKPQTPGNLVP